MVKVTGFLRGAKGKFQGATVYTSGGETIMREVVDVKNPQTDAQLIQRVIVKTVNAQYKEMKDIVNHSFEGRSMGKECQQRFLSLNSRFIRQRASELQAQGDSLNDFVNFMPVKSFKYMPTVVFVSEGSLPTVEATITAATSGVAAIAQFAAPANTYKSIIDEYGLQRGDQITLLAVEKNAQGDYRFNYARIILDPRTEEGLQASLDTPFIVEGAVNCPNSRNEGNFRYLGYDAETNNVQYRFILGQVAAAGIIVSRKGNDYYFRSTCKLVLNEEVLGSDATSLMGALDASKGGAVIDMEANPIYLNNAGVGGAQAQAGESGGSVDPDPQPSEAQVSDNVKFNATSGNFTSSVSGGNVSITEQLTGIEVSGTNLDSAGIKAGTTNNAAAATALTLSANNTKATYTPAEPMAAGSSLYVFKGDTLWFVATVIAENQEGGSGD